MTAWTASLAWSVRRFIGAALAAAPGAALLALYAGRIETFRRDSSEAPGTPDETVIALMVVGLAVASFLFARAVVAGRVNRSIGAGGVLSLTCVVAVLATTLIR